MPRKLGLAILTIFLILSFSALTWIYFQIDFPKKVPARAKQVINNIVYDHRFYT